MAFNASSVFQRLYNWRNDRDGGVKILAERMDLETDGLAQGLTDIMSGNVAYVGPLKSSDGTAALPAYSFSADADTGIYRKSDGTIGISKDGEEIGSLNAGVFGSPVAQCVFSYTSATVCTLSPKHGDLLKINGALYAVPSAGVTLANTSLTADTDYFVYAYMDSGTMTLEASETAYAVDTTAGNIGVEIKTGDASRTLVGGLTSDSSSEFLDTPAARNVASRHNQTQRILQGAENATQITKSGTSVTELDSTMRAAFFAFDGTVVEVGTNGYMWNDAAFSTMIYVALSPASAPAVDVRTKSGTAYGTDGGSAISSGNLTATTDGAWLISPAGARLGGNAKFENANGNRNGVSVYGRILG